MGRAGIGSEADFRGARSVGTTQSQVGKFLGQRLEISLEVTEHEPDKKISAKSTSGPFPIEVHYTFEPVAEGTRMKMGRHVDPRGFFKLTEPIIARMLTRQAETDISTLKDLLEAQA